MTRVPPTANGLVTALAAASVSLALGVGPAHAEPAPAAAAGPAKAKDQQAVGTIAHFRLAGDFPEGVGQGGL
ncbi:MAG: hypothetical protein FJ275_07705, partial [Planctomycetes bacterium]|nr:hypothetical protein [Planctomycetota bacterium]